MKALRPMVILLFLASVSSAGEWRFVSLDAGLNPQNPSLKLDTTGDPHISYYTPISADLKYAHWDGIVWRIETVDSEGYVGLYSSLALDSSAHPHISYYDSDNRAIRYAHWDGNEWLIETVDTGSEVGACNCLAVDDSDRPHIAYIDYSNDNLKYASWDGNAWRIETVDSAGSVYGFPSLALDSNNNAHISYCDYSQCLKYASWDGDEWLIETVDSGNFYCTSLTLDLYGYPRIAYEGTVSGKVRLKYARWDGDEWLLETVGSEGGGSISLALDSSEYPHISYYYAPAYDVKYASLDGDEWLIETVDSEDQVGWINSLALDSSDKPHIAYQDDTYYALKYAWYDPYSFHLLAPEMYEVVQTAMPLLDWGDTSDPDHKSYTLWWGTDYKFETYNEVTGISISEYTIPGGIEDGDCIYWRVKSIDGGGGENWAVETDWFFDTDFFHLLSPAKGEVVDAFPLTFDWQDQEIPGLESYILWWGEDPEFITYNEITDIEESEYTLSGGLEDGDRIYWRVKSLDSEGGEYWAAELDWYFDVDLGGGVDVADFGAGATDEGVLVNWRLSGEEPTGVRVLRGEGEPEIISGNLPGDSSRYLDRGVEPGVEYCYWLEVTEADGSVSRFGPTEAITLPAETFELVLYAAYP
ncbi:MAG: hypothetical protein NTW26_06880, partial [bacterium]|nr:hypothetical protein [bacterium]